jgi:hypothetical protein
MSRNFVLVALALGFGCAVPATVSGAAAPAAPDATTGGVSSVGYSSAILNGSVKPKGQETNYVFEYGPTHTYGTVTPLSPAGAGTTTVTVSQAVSGLEPLTSYHYRIVATSPAGTTKGSDHSFTTPAIPLSVAITGVPNPVVFGSSFLVDGTLSGTGSGSHEVVLQANPFPYLGGFQVIGNPEVTTATGGFSFPFLGLLENAQLRVVTVGTPEVSSPVVLESVAVRVTLQAHSVSRRGFVRLNGTVTPPEVGALVGFQLLIPGHRSVNEGGTGVRSDTSTYSRFSAVVRIRRHGLYSALIEAKDGSHVAGNSSPVLVR